MKLIAWPQPLGRLAFLGRLLLALVAGIVIFLALDQVDPRPIELAQVGCALLFFDALVGRARDLGYEGRAIYGLFGLVVLGAVVESIPSPLQHYGSLLRTIVILFALIGRTGSMKEKED